MFSINTRVSTLSLSLFMSANFKICERERRKTACSRWKITAFERGSRNKENWYRGWGRASARFDGNRSHKRIIQPEFTFYMRAEYNAPGTCAFIERPFHAGVIFVCAASFGQLSKFDRNCYRALSPRAVFRRRRPFFFLFFFRVGIFRFRHFHRWNVIVFRLGSRRWDFLRLSNEFPSGSSRREKKLWKEKKRTVVLETSSKLKFQLRAVVYVRLNLGQKMRKFSISVWSLLWARSSKNAEVLFRR